MYISGLGDAAKMEILKVSNAVSAGQISPRQASALVQLQQAWDLKAITIRNTAKAIGMWAPMQVEALVVSKIGPRPSLANIPRKIGPVGTSGGRTPLPSGPIVPVVPELPLGDDDTKKDNTMLYVGGAALIGVALLVLRK